MPSRFEAVEQQVVVGDDLRGVQHGGIASEMRVGDQRHIVAMRHSTAASRIHTIFGHAAGHDEMLDLARPKFFCQSRFVKRV